jgi:hypothetical protein
MANDDPCKKVLKNTCGETQCSVEYLFDHWPTDCKKVFELGQCVNVYQFGCSGSHGNFRSDGMTGFNSLSIGEGSSEGQIIIT